MGICRYCGQPAGFLRRIHQACREAHDQALRELSLAARDAAIGRVALAKVKQAMQAATSNHVGRDTARNALVAGWGEAVEHFLEDGVLDEEEEQHLLSFQREHNLVQAELDAQGHYSRLVKGGALRDIMNGTIPSRLEVAGVLPFNFQKKEQLVWLFQDVEYLEDKTRRHYEGGSAGMSFRVAKGVYFRTAAFKGYPVERTERVSGGRGLMGITNKHIYFAGERKSFRVRHDKIVTHMPFSNGVGIIRDAANAKPQIFVTADGWFTYNLLSNVSQL